MTVVPFTAHPVHSDYRLKTGRIRGHLQYHPNDSWDWDEVSPPILSDYKRNGRTVKGLIDVAREGYLWFMHGVTARSGSWRASPTCGRRSFAVSTRRPAGPTSIPIASRQPARRPRISAHRTGAGRTPTNSGVLATPMMFTIDGKQYVAIQSGRSIDSRLSEGRPKGITGTYPEVPEGGAIWVFAVP